MISLAFLKDFGARDWMTKNTRNAVQKSSNLISGRR